MHSFRQTSNKHPVSPCIHKKKNMQNDADPASQNAAEEHADRALPQTGITALEQERLQRIQRNQAMLQQFQVSILICCCCCAAGAVPQQSSLCIHSFVTQHRLVQFYCLNPTPSLASPPGGRGSTAAGTGHCAGASSKAGSQGSSPSGPPVSTTTT